MEMHHRLCHQNIISRHCIVDQVIGCTDMRIPLSEMKKEALQLLERPTPKVDSHTFHARLSAPYFVDVNEQAPDQAMPILY